jgi:hypothetical protein
LLIRKHTPSYFHSAGATFRHSLVAFVVAFSR